MDMVKDGVTAALIFKELDQTGDGVITADDFVQFAHKLGMSKFGDPIIKLAFKQVDVNKNGKLDYDEAMKAVSLFSKIQQQFGGQK